MKAIYTMCVFFLFIATNFPFLNYLSLTSSTPILILPPAPLLTPMLNRPFCHDKRAPIEPTYPLIFVQKRSSELIKKTKSFKKIFSTVCSLKTKSYVSYNPMEWAYFSKGCNVVAQIIFQIYNH